MADQDGGAAFPSSDVDEVFVEEFGRWDKRLGQPTGGMSLRDYFAAKAMLGEILTTCSDATPRAADALIQAANRAGQTPEERIAFNAYVFADAMLKARK